MEVIVKICRLIGSTKSQIEHVNSSSNGQSEMEKTKKYGKKFLIPLTWYDFSIVLTTFLFLCLLHHILWDVIKTHSLSELQ